MFFYSPGAAKDKLRRRKGNVGSFVEVQLHHRRTLQRVVKLSRIFLSQRPYQCKTIMFWRKQNTLRGTLTTEHPDKSGEQEQAQAEREREWEVLHWSSHRGNNGEIFIGGDASSDDAIENPQDESHPEQLDTSPKPPPKRSPTAFYRRGLVLCWLSHLHSFSTHQDSKSALLV